MSLTLGDVLQEVGLIQHAYFPVDCLVSLFAPLRNHHGIQGALIGSEGMVGVPLALGVRTSSVRAICQGSGMALRINALSFQREVQRNTALQAGIQRYVHVLMGQLTRAAACNACHSIEARCATCLLMTRDRMRSDEVELTQDHLARMLGVRRVSVTLAAGNLQRQGLIASALGRITILDPKQLAKSGCECYGVVKNLDADSSAQLYEGRTAASGSVRANTFGASCEQ